MNILMMNSSPVRDGATAEIIHQMRKLAPEDDSVTAICIDDYTIHYCKGCKSCYQTARCIHSDGVSAILSEFEKADRIVIVAPSYWADIPGQFKAFIDRCTPYCDTHEPHASIGKGKKGFAVALRTGSNPKECGRVIESIQHFYGHMGIEAMGSLSLCEVRSKEDVMGRVREIDAFCKEAVFA